MLSRFKSRIYKLLKRSEQYTKTDMIYLASGGFWMTAGTIAGNVIALGTTVAFANLLSKETFGFYQYVLSTVAILSVLGLSGVVSAVTRAVAQGKEASVLEGFWARLRWGALSGLLSAAIAAYYFVQDNYLLGAAFLIAALFITIWDAPGLYNSYLQGKERFDLLNIYDVLAQGFAALWLVGTLLVSNDLIVILTVYFTSWTLARFFLFQRTIKRFPPNNEHDYSLIRYSKHLTLMSAMTSISTNLDKFLVWHLLGPVPVAVYTFALAVPQRIAGSIKIINRLAFPRLATKDLSLLQTTLLRKVLLFSTLALVCAGGYALAAPFIFSIFFPQYTEAIAFSQLASLLIALQPFTLFATSLNAQGQQRALYIQNIAVPTVRIAFLLALVPFFGINGALTALIGARIFEAILLVVLFHRAQSEHAVS